MKILATHIKDPKRDEPLGMHYLVELFECSTLPTSPDVLKEQMETAAKLVGATVVTSVFHQYNPHGLSGVVVIAESHFAIHTWPEYKVASLDLFSCKELNPEQGLHYLEEKFGANDIRITAVERGI